MLSVWNLQKWALENVWESEEGDSMSYISARNYHWDYASTWIDDERIAIAGIGNDAQQIPFAAHATA